MKTFEYTLADELGIHVRPAGFIVREAGKYDSAVKLRYNDKEANAKQLFSVMQLAAKYNDTLTVEISGPDEDAALEGLKELFDSQKL